MLTAKAILNSKIENLKEEKCPYCGNKLDKTRDTGYSKEFFCTKEEIRITVEG